MRKVAQAAVEILESVVPSELLNMLKRHADKNVPFVFGREDNKYISKTSLCCSSKLRLMFLTISFHADQILFN